jgi:3-dehydroquinate dehydratase-2
MKILIVNGPNLNLLGKREPEIYGSQSFDDYLVSLRTAFPDLALEYFQSNHEGALIDKLQESGFSVDGIVLNAGALTHTSMAIADAIAAIKSPVIEVHISNVYKRETFRHHSWLSAVCVGCIVGLGLDGYRLAIEHFLKVKSEK